ncbi:gliding motility-associated C-terminal domain-containing protein, partial [Flavobacterium sp. RSSB_23]
TVSKVTIAVTQAATPISAGLVPILDINTGKVNVPAGTPAGNYIIKYRICEKLNSSNCDEANILITVIAAKIVATNDTVSNVNGYAGANSVINALTNDQLNALPMKALDIKITQITPPVAINGGPVPTLNLITGNVSVPAKTPAGTYVIGYQVCEKLNPTNCDAAKITIVVNTPVIDAINDAVAVTNGYTGAQDVLNVTQNDVLNGSNVIASEITTTVVTPANSINAGAIPTLNTTTGYVSVPAGTTAGVYTIVYRICETLNPSNCDTATATITVNPPVIEANDDLVGSINGLVGATDVINAITNDNLNGVPMQLTEVNLTELVPATPIGGGLVPQLDTATGAVNVPANTPVGSYSIQYRVCEKQNPTNCDDATITINVVAAK